MSDGVISMLDCDNEGESLVELIESGRKILREAAHKNPVLVLEANTAIAYEERVGKLITEIAALREALDSLVVSVFEMHSDNRKGDFKLPKLARLDLDECVARADKALEATK